MTLRNSIRIVFTIAVCAIATAGCSRNKPTAPWPLNSDPVVFREASDFGTHQVEFQAFAGSKYDALSVDSTVHYTGAVSLKFIVPDQGDPSGGYAGGAFVASHPRSLAPYNALRFWVKSSRATTLNEVGLGNDNTGTSKYVATRTTIPLKTWWQQVVIPIPLAARLGAERGLFYVAEGPQSGTGLTFWVDDIEFVNDLSITNPRPQLTTQTVTGVTGTSIVLKNATRTIYSVGGSDVTVVHDPGYFTFASSDPSIARVAEGTVYVDGAGSATLTAKLGSIDATGTITVNATAPPMTAAPTPALPDTDVISLFSNAYTNVPVDNWRSFGSPAAQYQELSVAGDATKLYTGLTSGYVGIQFATPTIDATAMTAFHLDVWLAAGTTFRVKLVDFGADGIFGGSGVNADSQDELTFTPASTPPLVDGAWVGLEIPLANFANLTNRAHLGQLILSGGADTPTVFVDNIYFHK